MTTVAHGCGCYTTSKGELRCEQHTPRTREQHDIDIEYVSWAETKITRLVKDWRGYWHRTTLWRVNGDSYDMALAVERARIRETTEVIGPDGKVRVSIGWHGIKQLPSSCTCEVFDPALQSECNAPDCMRALKVYLDKKLAPVVTPEETFSLTEWGKRYTKIINPTFYCRTERDNTVFKNCDMIENDGRCANFHLNDVKGEGRVLCGSCGVHVAVHPWVMVDGKLAVPRTNDKSTA